MQHKGLLTLTFDRIDDLGITLCAQGRDHQRLRFAAGEQGGAVRARKYPDTDMDGAHLLTAAAIDTSAALKDQAAYETVFEFLKSSEDLCFRPPGLSAFLGLSEVQGSRLSP